MDLSSLETAAAISKHAVVLLASGVAIAGYRAWYFTVKKEDAKRLQAQFAVVVLTALGACAGFSVYYFTDEINLALRSKVATLEKGAEDTGNELALLQAKTAKAVRRQAEDEIKLAEIRKRQEARTFDEDIFLSILATAPPGKIKIGYIQGGPEPATLASTLWIALRKAKWNVLEFKPVVSVIGRGYSPETEVFLLMRDIDNMSLSQQALQRALRKAEFQLQTTRDETVPADMSVLWIGPKL